MYTKRIEIWSDSFHEGEWCCENICTIASSLGLSYKVEYIKGFQPMYIISDGTYNIQLIVFGSYKSWDPLPKQIKELIEWGKPDFIAYEPNEDKILFAVEETAATPTGNQALQRCERLYGSARKKIPYWYLVSEYSQHSDGGIRRDSIWPSIMAIKLTMYFKTPCLVLHYSDIDNPENYTSGAGLNYLFESLFQIIKNYVLGSDNFFDMIDSLTKQYKSMLSFIASQWKNIVDFLPGEALLKLSSTSENLAKYAINSKQIDSSLLSNFLIWPKLNDLSKILRELQSTKKLIKYDRLCYNLEQDVGHGKAYCLSSNAGSGQPQSYEKIKKWVNQQRELFLKAPLVNPPAIFNISAEDFPKTESGNRHITTAKNIVYLYDKWKDVRETIENSYPRLIKKLSTKNDNQPVFVYISNSLRPGRLFGDPYTGQISAYSTVFGKFDINPRIVIAYFPHQVHYQAIEALKLRGNKGKIIMKELTDYLLFAGGVLISLRTGEIL